MSVLCLQICQAAMVYVNVLMIQDALADPRLGRLTLFWSHVLPYGEAKLDINTRLALSGPPPG